MLLRLKILSVLIPLLCFSSAVYAYQIVATDDVGYGYEDGKWTKDSHRYQTTYSVDESGGTLTETEVKDLNSGEAWVGSTYTILNKAEMPLFIKGNPLKAMRFNSKVQKVEVITFNQGKYIWTKNSDTYVNVFSGKYKIDF